MWVLLQILILLLPTLLSPCVFADTYSQIIGRQLNQNNKYHTSGPYGSKSNPMSIGGRHFTDFYQSVDGRVIYPRNWPDTINIRHGSVIDGIQIFYGGSYSGEFHGGRRGGKLTKLRMYNGDKIIRITGRQGIGPGAGIDQLKFYTKEGKIYGPFGGNGGYGFDARPPGDNCFLAWISGHADLRLDSISFTWRCPETFHNRHRITPRSTTTSTASSTRLISMTPTSSSSTITNISFFIFNMIAHYIL